LLSELQPCGVLLIPNILNELIGPYLSFMKFKVSALRKLLIESIDQVRFIRERPWSIEYAFALTGGSAIDSEGLSPDGFAIVMKGESGKEMKVVVDTYWNPTSGDESGNSIRVEYEDEKMSTYVPTRLDDGEQQLLTISNTPIPGIITVFHSSNFSSIPIVYLVATNPFEMDEEVEFLIEKMGNGKAEVKLTGYTNL